MDDIVIIGFGGHAKSVADSILGQEQYSVVGYTDKSDRDSRFKYLGTDNKLEILYDSGIHNAVLGIGYLGNSDIREKMVQDLKKIGYKFPLIIDPSSVLAFDIRIGEGTFVGKNAVINAGAVIGDFVILNTAAVIEHECVVGRFSHIAVGATICGGCIIGDNVFIGANATVIQGVKIGMNSIIGAGSLVLADVPENTRVLGAWERKGR